MRYCYLLGLLVIFANSKAQIAANGWIIEDIHGPSQVGIVDSIPVDLNQDGLMDVVSASIDDGHLRAYINQGGYQFEQEYISKELPGIYRVTATDINQDGQTDFLLPSIATHEVIVLIKDEQGYNKQTIATAVVLPTDAQAADFNQDGLVDVVSVSFENDELLLHLQQANGTYQTQIISSAAQNPRKLQINDFNNDSFPDILLASSGDDSVRLYSNLGNAVFAENLISNRMIGTRFITECDFNNDDLMDFAVSATGVDTVYLFTNTGNNQFIPNTIDNNLLGANALHCADIDNDQQTELVSVASNSGNIYTHELTGNLNRQLIANTRDGYVSVHVAAFDQNQPPQILTQAYYENRNLLYATVVSNQEIVVWEDFPDGATRVFQADINNDGINDIVATSFRDGRVQWYNGYDHTHEIIAENIDGAADLVVGDFNRDGFIDVITAASFDNRFYLHLNNQSEGFETTILFNNALFANGLAVADIDFDGWLDVFGSSGSDDSLRWFKFNESEVEIYNLGVTGDAPSDVEIADIDADGNIDLLVVNLFSGDVVIFRNSGLNTFAKEVISKGWSRPFATTFQNEKNTKLLNLVVTMSADNQVIKFEQISPLKFHEKLIFDASNNPRKIISSLIDKSLYITSPSDQSIYIVDKNLKSKAIITDYMGVSDINFSDINNKFLTSSFELSSISFFTKDLIFKSSFNDQSN